MIPFSSNTNKQKKSCYDREYKLFRKIFNNKYLFHLIFSLIRSHDRLLKAERVGRGKKFTILSYDQIRSTDWMCHNGHFGLLVYKLREQERRLVSPVDGYERLVFTYQALYSFARGCKDMAMFKFIYGRYREMVHSSYRVFDECCLNGDLEIIEFLHREGVECSVEAMNNAARTGRFDIVRFLHRERSEGCTVSAVDMAAKNGHFEICKFLLESRDEGCSDRAIFGAVCEGHIEIVKYLLAHRKWESESIFSKKVDSHAISLAIVKFLYKYSIEHNEQMVAMSPELSVSSASHQSSDEVFKLDVLLEESIVVHCNSPVVDIEYIKFLCSTIYSMKKITKRYQHFIKIIVRCIIYCCQWSHLEVIQYLIKRYSNDLNYYNSFSLSNWLDVSATMGNIEAFRLIESSFPKIYCTKSAMDQSFPRFFPNTTIDFSYRYSKEFHQRQLDVIQYLSCNRSEGCTFQCMDEAARYGNYDLVVWLNENRKEGCSSKAFDYALINHYPDIFDYLLKHFPLNFGDNIITNLLKKGNRFGSIQMLVEKFNIAVQPTDISSALDLPKDEFLYLLEKTHNRFTFSSLDNCITQSNFYKFKILIGILKEDAKLLHEILPRSNILCYVAARHGEFEFVKYLIENNLCQFSKSSIHDIYQSSFCIDAAALSGKIEIVKYLHSKFPNRFMECSSLAVEYASLKGHIGVVKFLLENRSEPLTETAFNNAIARGHLEVVSILIDHFPKCKDNINYLHFANIASEHGHIEIIKLLERSPHFSRSMMFVPACVDLAIKGNQLALIHYYQRQNYESFSANGFLNALKDEKYDIINFLIQKYPDRCCFQYYEDTDHSFMKKIKNRFELNYSV